MEITYIYTLRHPENLSIRYVGKTKNPQTRLSAHISKAKRNKRNLHLNNWINLILQEDNLPIFEIIDICYEDWKDRERYWVDYYRSQNYDLINIADGGQSNSGYTSTEEQRKQISRTLKDYWSENKYPHKGKDKIDYIYGDYNIDSKLTEEEVLEIREKLKEGYNTRYLGDEYGVHKCTINDIKLGKTWQHLGEFRIEGHLRKITPEKVDEVKDLLEDHTYREIQEIANISRPTITKIKRGHYD